MTGRRLAAGLLAAGLVAVTASDAPARPPPPKFHIRPAASPAPSGLSRDEGAYRMAVAAIQRRDYAAALDSLEAALSRGGDSARVLNAFGVVYDKIGRFDLSAHYYSRALALDPDSAIIKANQAYSRILQGHIAPSTEAIVKPVLSEPGP